MVCVHVCLHAGNIHVRNANVLPWHVKSTKTLTTFNICACEWHTWNTYMYRGYVGINMLQLETVTVCGTWHVLLWCHVASLSFIQDKVIRAPCLVSWCPVALRVLFCYVVTWSGHCVITRNRSDLCVKPSAYAQFNFKKIMAPSRFTHRETRRFTHTLAARIYTLVYEHTQGQRFVKYPAFYLFGAKFLVWWLHAYLCALHRMYFAVKSTIASIYSDLASREI